MENADITHVEVLDAHFAACAAKRVTSGARLRLLTWVKPPDVNPNTTVVTQAVLLPNGTRADN